MLSNRAQYQTRAKIAIKNFHDYSKYSRGSFSGLIGKRLKIKFSFCPFEPMKAPRGYWKSCGYWYWLIWINILMDSMDGFRIISKPYLHWMCYCALANRLFTSSGLRVSIFSPNALKISRPNAVELNATGFEHGKTLTTWRVGWAFSKIQSKNSLNYMI